MDRIYRPIFQDKSNGSIFKIPGRPHHGAGGQVDQGPGGVHLIGGGVVQPIFYFFKSN